MAMNESKSLSLAGWDLKKWLAGNKEAVKLVVSAVIGIANSSGDVVVAGVITIAGKAVLDIVDFYVSNVSLKK